MSKQALPKNICKIFPSPTAPPDIDIINFVYETHAFPTGDQLRTSYALCLVTSGKGQYTVAGKAHPLGRGDLFLIFSAKRFQLSSDNALTYCYISFTGLQIHKLLHRLQISVLAPVFHGYGSLIPHWRDALHRATQDNLDMVALSVFYKTLSYLAVRFQSEDKEATEKKGDRLMAQIKIYIDEHFQEASMNLDSIAAYFGYHPKYVSNRFKQVIGCTVTQYITDCRMRYARELLYEGYTSVSMIADACGFRDPMYFSRVFARTYGCSPLTVRKEIQIRTPMEQEQRAQATNKTAEKDEQK
jgi:AraC-like DNA-binding protein